MVIKKSMILIVLLNLLFIECTSMYKSNFNNDALLFENYSKEMELPKDFFLLIIVLPLFRPLDQPFTY
ncbi:MAG: hypothetical protein AB7E53_02365, partial [Macellibacteroides sp.]|uniref:hypothetical protein n=1 Tax=Macellibacteroides sp. TaxID=2014584 RepID=UPI003E7C45EE